MGTGTTRRAARRNARITGQNESIVDEIGEENKKPKSGSAKAGNSEAGKDKRGSAETGTEKGGNTASEGGEEHSNTVNPASLADDIYERDENGEIVLTATGRPRKKRGRKPGTTVKSNSPRAKAKGASVGVEMLAAQFQILNTGIAYLTRFDDFQLSDEEAMQMSQATANVMEQFDYTPDPKVTAVLGLVTATGMIYGPRVYLYRSHLKKVSEEKRKAREANADETVASQQDYSPVYPNSGSQFSG